MSLNQLTPVIDEVNRYWNQRIRQVNEPRGMDYWQLPSETIYWGTGDCEDVAILKLFTMVPVLSHSDIPIHLLTINHRSEGAHVVLLVGTWVLDNLLDDLVDIKEYGELYINNIRFTSDVNGNDGSDPRFVALLRRAGEAETALAYMAFTGQRG